MSAQESPGASLLPAKKMIDTERLRAAYEKVRDELLAERTAPGHWVGELSSSALATATAVSALAVVRRVQGSGLRAREGADAAGEASGGRSTEYSVLTTQYDLSRIDDLI